MRARERTAINREQYARRMRTRGNDMKKPRKSFDERLAHAVKRDNLLGELVLGNAPPTTATRLQLFARCRYWCFDSTETAVLLDVLEARDLA
jgi:hypothetical protein